ncbi:uncharacterized protein [Leptinotarsa decemlineata]|uniref:uncharacterized protein n=1 Tax=Leptinotarsa decemlineata TaxID=7539 RepID=UPI003D30BF03
MGRYERKSFRKNWPEQNMQQAIDAVKQKIMGWLMASKKIQKRHSAVLLPTTLYYPSGVASEHWMFCPADVTDLPNDESIQRERTEEVVSITPGPSGIMSNKDDFDENREVGSISMAEISPLPKASASQRRKYGVINTTPEIDLAKQLVADKKAQALRKFTRAAKKVLIPEEDSEKDSSDLEDDVAYIFCNELYSRSRAGETDLLEMDRDRMRRRI